MMLFSALLFILSIGLMLWVHKYRDVSDVKAMSVVFTHLTLVGCASMCIGTFFIGLGYDQASCVILEWFQFTGIWYVQCAMSNALCFVVPQIRRTPVICPLFDFGEYQCSGDIPGTAFRDLNHFVCDLRPSIEQHRADVRCFEIVPNRVHFRGGQFHSVRFERCAFAPVFCVVVDGERGAAHFVHHFELSQWRSLYPV